MHQNLIDRHPVQPRRKCRVAAKAADFAKQLNKNVPEGESSAAIRERIAQARAIQLERFAGEKVYSNSAMSPAQIRIFCALDAESENLLEKAMARQGLSARAHDRILKVARTIADLDADGADIQPVHIGEAINYRSLDRNYWT